MERKRTSGLGTSRSTFIPVLSGTAKIRLDCFVAALLAMTWLGQLTKKPRPIGRGWKGRTRRGRQRILAKVAWSSARSLAFFVRSLAFVTRSASRAFLVLRVLFS